MDIVEGQEKEAQARFEWVFKPSLPIGARQQACNRNNDTGSWLGVDNPMMFV